MQPRDIKPNPRQAEREAIRRIALIRSCRLLFGLVIQGLFLQGALAQSDVRQTARGEIISVPFQSKGTIEKNTCVEFLVQETGEDVRLSLVARDEHRRGVDGDIRRYGIQLLAYCASEKQEYEFSVSAVDGKSPAATGRMQFHVITDETKGFQALSQAFAEFSASRASARQFAESAALFDKNNDRERAALAWFFAEWRGEAELDLGITETAFNFAIKHAEEHGDRPEWIRIRVVLLNNRALFVAARDRALATRMIEESFSLQRQLHDRKLASDIESNRCLVPNYYGDLNKAEGCFQRVLKERLQMEPGALTVAAVRNNLAVVHLHRGQYKQAEVGFRLAAAERMKHDDKFGYLVSVGNAALCEYQLGRIDAALNTLLNAFEFAQKNSDKLGAAKMAEYLAGIYLAWGDANAASAFVQEAEQTYRNAHRVADTAAVLRLRARIEQEKGDLAAAEKDIREAWVLSTDRGLYQIAANVAGVYANILLDKSATDEAEQFIAEARRRIAESFPKSDLLNLQTAELRRLRMRGEAKAARALAQHLLNTDLLNPGALRTAVLIERFLDDQSSATCIETCPEYYALLREIRKNVVQARDPELAYRLLEIVRPAADVAIGKAMQGCPGSGPCARESLMRALEYFSLEPRYQRNSIQNNDELAGLLQTLSGYQARGDLSAATPQIIRRIKQLQTAVRRQQVSGSETAGDCSQCDQITSPDGGLFFFFGALSGWRWQPTRIGWTVTKLPNWPTLMENVRKFPDMNTRRSAILGASQLVSGMEILPDVNLVVRGDARLAQIPFPALLLDSGEYVVDRYTTRIEYQRRGPDRPEARVAVFLSADPGGADALPMIASERESIRAWAGRNGIAVQEEMKSSFRPVLTHISGHAQRDLGGGISVLWLKDRPMLSFLSDDAQTASAVVINTCESGAAADFGVSQSTIAAGFLRAGAKHVAATLFTIGDHAAAEFAKRFYSEYEPAKDNFAYAVRQAQIELKSKGRAEWAAYTTLARIDQPRQEISHASK